MHCFKLCEKGRSRGTLIMFATEHRLGTQQTESRRISEQPKEAMMIRRRFQIGALEKRGRTYRLRYRVDIIGKDGTVAHRERKSVPFGKVTKQEAIRLRGEFIRRHGISKNRPKATMTLGEFWNLHFVPNIVRKKSH